MGGFGNHPSHDPDFASIEMPSEIRSAVPGLVNDSPFPDRKVSMLH
jgi:hypothetical protein